MSLFVSSQRLRRIVLTAMCVGGLTALGLAQAQSWPQKPIRVIVNFPPGGAADQIARAVAQPLGEALGQSVVVENRGGANGNIGGEAVAKSAADGHTLLMSSGGMVSINPHLYNKMPFDPMKDLVPVAAAARVLVFLEVRPSLQINDFKTFLDFVKANPGKLNYASGGVGSSAHMSAELFKSMAGIDMAHIPYKGSAPAVNALMADESQVMVGNLPPWSALIKSGKVQALAVTTPKRLPQFPDVPTVSESGLSGFEFNSWFAMMAPANTPKPIVEKLHAEISKALADPSIKEQLFGLGLSPRGTSPDQLATELRAQFAKYGILIRQANITAE